MSRKKKLLLNTGAGILKQLVTVICGFILPRYMLLYYGSSVNGLISSISHFLSFISLLDMGVGAVIQANLYKPLADKNEEQISLILKSSERFFRRLAYIFIAYIIVLCFAFPSMVEFGAWYTISLLVIISISTLAQYLFGMTYQLLLNADQKSYVQLVLAIGTVILNTVFAVILMRMGASVHVVKLMTAAVFVLRPIGQMIYVHKHYNINKNIKLVGEPIKQKWNGFSQHLAAVICQNIDVVVLTVFSSLKNVSIYSVYYNVTNGVEQIIMTAATGLEALFGNMIAKGEKDKLLKTFNAVEWVVHTGVTVVFTVAAITIVPFISVYTRGITDADYIAPLFGMLLVAAYGAQCLRIPYFRVIKAAGHFKETQNGAYISAVLNVIITIGLVFEFGLIGAAVGTLVAMVYHTCYFVWYLRKNILERSAIYFIKYVVTDLIVACVSYAATKGLLMTDVSYINWVLLAVEVTMVVLVVSLAVNLIFYRRLISNMTKYVRGGYCESKITLLYPALEGGCVYAC